jgi:ABC-2 type transport system permease protein
LKNEHLNVESLITATLQTIPDDAASVLLIAPTKQLQDSEIQMLSNYAEKGGGLVMFVDPRGSTQVRDLAKRFGIEIRDDVVIDTVQRLFAGPALGLEPIAKTYGTHPITRDLRAGQDLTLFNIASSIETPKSDSSSNAKYVELVKTGSDSWSEINLAAIFDSEQPTVEFSTDDVKGPVTLTVAYEKPVSAVAGAPGDAAQSPEDSGRMTKVVVYGDSDWVKNGVIGNVFNKDLALNSVAWVSGQEAGLSIRPRSLSASETAMTPDDIKTVLVSSFVLPELILIFGLFIWWKRREVGAGLA